MFNIRVNKKDFSPLTWTIQKKSSNPSSSTFSTSVLLTKSSNDFRAFPKLQNLDLPKFHRQIAYLEKTSEGFQLIPLKTKLRSYYDDFWLIINKESVPSIRISQGETLRIFNTFLVFKEVAGFYQSPSEVTIYKDYQTDKEKEKKKLTFKEVPTVNPEILIEHESFCRICLEETDSASNPFIKPCYCSGGMGSIHLECFEKWIDSKLTVKSLSHLTIISWEKIACESCKYPIHDQAKFPQAQYNIFSKFQPSNKFVMIRKIDPNTQKKNSLIVVDCSAIKKFYLHPNGKIGFEKKVNTLKVLVKDTELLILNKKKAEFCYSILVQQPFQIPVGGKSFSFINGMSVLDFSVRKKFSFKACLCLKA